MVRNIIADRIFEYIGLSTDTKPIDDGGPGSTFYETDTQKDYIFDGSQWWVKASSSSSGGSSGGSTFDDSAIIDDLSNPLTVSLSISPATAETGSTVSSVVGTWTNSKTPASQVLNGTSVAVGTLTKTITGSYTADTTFTYSATTTAGVTKNATATLDFCNGVYYGVSSSTTYDSTLISSLTKVLSDNKVRTITVAPGSGQYIYYAIPSRLGIPSFSVGGFSGGFSKVASALSFKNSSNYTETYDIWASDNANLGSTTVVIA